LIFIPLSYLVVRVVGLLPRGELLAGDALVLALPLRVK
jgi:hypothetical protein